MAQIDNSRSRPRPKARKSAKKAGKARASARHATPSAHIGPDEADPRRRTPNQKRARDTALSIVIAAEQLLVQVGYAGTSTNAIARRAGVSIGSLYQYFDDKESVFRAVVRRHREEMMPMILAALDDMADPRKGLVDVTLDLMRQMARANAHNPQLMAAIESELGWLEHESDDNLQMLARVCGILAQRTKLPPQEIPVIAQLMFATVAHLSRWLVHGKPPDLDAERFIVATGRMLRALFPLDQSPRSRRPTDGHEG